MSFSGTSSYLMSSFKVGCYTLSHLHDRLTVKPGFGIMPLQLLNLGVLIPRMIFRIFWTRTPRGTYAVPTPSHYNSNIV